MVELFRIGPLCHKCSQRAEVACKGLPIADRDFRTLALMLEHMNAVQRDGLRAKLS